MIAARRIDRLQQVEVALERHAPLGAARRAAEVGDLRVQPVRGIDGDAQRAGNLLVRAGRAEGLPVEHECALVDVEGDGGHERTPSIRMSGLYPAPPRLTTSVEQAPSTQPSAPGCRRSAAVARRRPLAERLAIVGGDHLAEARDSSGPILTFDGLFAVAYYMLDI